MLAGHMSSAGRKLFHRGQVPFLAGFLSFPPAGTGSGGVPGLAARAVTARNACASMDKVTILRNQINGDFDREIPGRPRGLQVSASFA